MQSNRFSGVSLAALVAIASSVWTGVARGQCELDRWNGSSGGEPGYAVDISGEWAAIGAPSAGGPGGTVRMHRRDDAGTPMNPTDDTWPFHSEIIPNTPTSGNRFGASVSINGTYLVVGAPEEDIGALTKAGKAYIFRFDGTNWVQDGSLSAIPFAGATAFFGRSVGISKGPTDDPIVVVGAPYEQYPNVISGGTAYIFRWSEFAGKWTRRARLIPSDVSNYIVFGLAVAASSGEGIERVVIGAPYVNPAQGPGSAYVFENTGDDTWQET